VAVQDVVRNKTFGPPTKEDLERWEVEKLQRDLELAREDLVSQRRKETRLRTEGEHLVTVQAYGKECICCGDKTASSLKVVAVSIQIRSTKNGKYRKGPGPNGSYIHLSVVAAPDQVLAMLQRQGYPTQLKDYYSFGPQILGPGTKITLVCNDCRDVLRRYSRDEAKCLRGIITERLNMSLTEEERRSA
jgi:hypothetical protein